MTIENICNQALDVIGYPRKIGNIYEGTKAARAFLNTWVETRDALLDKVQPDWAKTDTTLTLLKLAPGIINGSANYGLAGWNTSYPQIPWLYEYQYPANCITPLQVKSPLGVLPIWRPRARPFRENFSASGRTILTNEPAAILIYIAVVSDPDAWHNEFTEMMIMALAKKVEAEVMPQQAAHRRQQEQQQQERQDGNAAG